MFSRKINGGESNCSNNFAAIVDRRPKQLIWLLYRREKWLYWCRDLSWYGVSLSHSKHVIKAAINYITVPCSIKHDSAFNVVLSLCCKMSLQLSLFIFLFVSRPPVTSVLLLTLMSPKWLTSMESSNKVWSFTDMVLWCCDELALYSLRQLFEMVNIRQLKL